MGMIMPQTPQKSRSWEKTSSLKLHQSSSMGWNSVGYHGNLSISCCSFFLVMVLRFARVYPRYPGKGSMLSVLICFLDLLHIGQAISMQKLKSRLHRGGVVSTLTLQQEHPGSSPSWVFFVWSSCWEFSLGNCGFFQKTSIKAWLVIFKSSLQVSTCGCVVLWWNSNLVSVYPALPSKSRDRLQQPLDPKKDYGCSEKGKMKWRTWKTWDTHGQRFG